MGIRISAKATDYRKAVERLEAKGGSLEGTTKGIVKALGFDGGWKEFITYTGVSVRRTDLGRFCVSVSQQTKSDPDKIQVNAPIDPIIFATCASAYILGEGCPEDFEDYHGLHNTISHVTDALATEIDVSIGTLYLPYETEADIELYSVDRGLLYTASGDGTFTIYGSAVLANA